MRYAIAVETQKDYEQALSILQQEGLRVRGLDYEGNQQYYVGGVADYLMDDRLFAKHQDNTSDIIELSEAIRNDVKAHLTEDVIISKLYAIIEKEMRHYIRQYGIEMEIV